MIENKYESTSTEDKENCLKLPKKLLPPVKYPGKYKYIEDFIDCAEACDELLNEADGSRDLLILGFDLEWPFSYQTGSAKTALMQVCASSNDQMTYLFHIFDFAKLPVAMAKLLSHPNVRLAGVNVRNDVSKLCKDFKGLDKKNMLNNCVDSMKQTKQIINVTLPGYSMDKLVSYFFHETIDKSDPVRISRWDKKPLTTAQKVYAATDAYISLRLYKHLISLENDMKFKILEERISWNK